MQVSNAVLFSTDNGGSIPHWKLKTTRREQPFQPFLHIKKEEMGADPPNLDDVRYLLHSRGALQLLI
jgi:hypothetical protein